MTRKRRTWLVLLGSTALLIVLFALLTHENEPHYKGRPLGYWVTRLGDPTDRPRASEEAIAAIGTNAVPLLLEWIQYEHDPANEMRYSSINSILVKLPFRFTVSDRDSFRATGAMLAFESLHCEDPTALELLSQLATGPKAWSTNDATREVALRATQALGWLGHGALPSLLFVATNQQPKRFNRFCALDALGEMGTNALSAIPAIIPLLSDPDELLRWQTARTLGRLRLRCDIVVPALVARLESYDPSLVDAAAAEALGEFGAEASCAIPALTNALTNPDPEMRRVARSALQRIAPDTLTNAPPG